MLFNFHDWRLIIMDPCGKNLFLCAVLTVVLSLVNFVNSALPPEQNEILEKLDLLDIPKYAFKFGTSEDDLQILRNAVIPQHMQHFLKMYQENSNSKASLDDVLDVVEDPDCRGHIREWFKRVGNLSTLFNEENQWVSQMVDSWGKFPEGILSGHFNSFGDFWECLNIDVSDLEILSSALPDTAKSFQGRYCTTYIADYYSAHGAAGFLPEAEVTRMKSEQLSVEKNTGAARQDPRVEVMMSVSGGGFGLLPPIPSIATCMPNSCSQSDIQRFLVKSLNVTYNSLLLNATLMPFPLAAFCNENKKPDLDSSTITFIVFLAILAALCITAAVYDYYLTNFNGGSGWKDPSLPVKYFLAFSVYTNTKKFLSTRKGAEDFGCLHGIRTLSTLWVVLSHTYLLSMFVPLWNGKEASTSYENNPTSMAIYNGFFSVDTFFLMSGTLACYGLLKVLDKSGGKLNIPMFYLHRYIRLTPLYAFLIGVAATLLNYMGNGPYWDLFMAAPEKFCRDNWWVNLLYINNLYKTDEQCNGESWYLANDMQFYFLSPFIVYPIWRWEKIGLALLAVYTALSMASPAILVNHHGTIPLAIMTRAESDGFQTYVYQKPYARIGVFLIGIFLGWLLYKTRGKRVRLHWTVAIGCWLLASAGALFVIFCVYPWYDVKNDIPKAYGLFYAGASRHIWGVCIGWIIFACVKGYGGIINQFLSWSAFMPLGRLCFSVYLTSYHFQQIYQMRLTKPFVFDTYNIVNLFFSHVVMSYLAAYMCTILFESPFMLLQKFIFEAGGSRKPHVVQENAKVEAGPSSPETTVDMKEK